MKNTISETSMRNTLNTCIANDNRKSVLLNDDESKDTICNHDSADKRDTLPDVGTPTDGKAAYFDNEIREAEQMIQLLPSNPDVYLKAGRLYSLLGYQRRAMDVYKQGLNNVDRKHHHVFQQQYDSADAKCQLRIDIPGLLPYDLISIIAEGLASQDHLTVLDVSKMWRSKFSQCSPIWATIVVNPFYDTYAADTIPKLAYHVGSHILNVTLYGVNGTYTEAFFGAMINGDFNNLKHLTLIYCPAYNGSGLIAGLRSVAETLTKLELNLAEPVTATGDDATLPYKTILSLCPNLEQFRYDHDACDVSQATLGSLGPAYTSKLIEFQLKSSRIELVNIEDILGSSPELRSLELVGCTSAVVDVALAKCRKLEFISLDDNVQYIDYVWIDENRISRPPEAGVCTLTATIGNPDHFATLFEKHCNTIEGLSLDFTKPPIGRWVVSINAFGDFSNLIFLALQCSDNDGSIIASALIRRSPSLLRLQFIAQTEDIDNSLISAIVDAPRLRELCVTNTAFSELNLRTLFQGFAAKTANQSTLQKITLSDIYCDARFTIANVLDCLPDIATLRKVEIAWCRSAPESAIIRFCKRLQSHPYIEAITFEDLDCITDESLKSLAGIKGLRNLRLASIENITEQGIQFFTGSSVKLNVLGCGARHDICI